jgi:hypothetical protein
MWEHGYLKLPRYDDSTYEAKKKQKDRAKLHFTKRLEYYVSLLKVELKNAIDQEQIIQIKKRLDNSQKRLQQIRKSA